MGSHEHWAKKVIADDGAFDQSSTDQKDTGGDGVVVIRRILSSSSCSCYSKNTWNSIILYVKNWPVEKNVCIYIYIYAQNLALNMLQLPTTASTWTSWKPPSLLERSQGGEQMVVARQLMIFEPARGYQSESLIIWQFWMDIVIVWHG